MLLVILLFWLVLTFGGYWLMRYLHWPQRVWRWAEDAAEQRLKHLPRALCERWQLYLTHCHADYRLARWFLQTAVALLLLILAVSALSLAPFYLLLLLLMVLPLARGKRRLQQRLTLVEQQLPALLDLLMMLISAGAPISLALQQLAQQLGQRPGHFHQALARTAVQLRQGMTLSQALQRLVLQYPLPRLQRLRQLLIQLQQSGHSSARLLAFEADELRREQLQRAESHAQRATIKMLLPLVLCFFPVNFIVLLGPIFIQLTQGGGL
ncbi:type II secretion system F family protein [Idiomarina xiamenensis]|uniref:Flp pilus assembly protein TadC n=1 Tax=Idiomarina xiamenensis 10-D-4 TaxID=740709 RepID=K2KJK1_9GAMM|nr:type II secretion system F family protein [Idiomarina xiamenensis]EKE82759.1 Flp pilus assembly protein TadC [Idiomarina xiamenensis 10-D-4]